MAYVGAQGLWEVARPHLVDLVSRTGESSSMAQLDGSDIVYVARVSVPKIIALRVEIGTRFPAAQTSQGKVLLAALAPDEVAPTLAQPSQSGLPPYIGRRSSSCWRSSRRSAPAGGRWPTRSSRPASVPSRSPFATARAPCARR